MSTYDHPQCENVIQAMIRIGRPASSKQIGIEAGLDHTAVQFPLKELIKKDVVTKYGNGFLNLKPRPGANITQKSSDKPADKKPSASAQRAAETLDKVITGTEKVGLLEKCDRFLEQLKPGLSEIPELSDIDIKLAMLEKFRDITEEDISQQFHQIIVWIKRVNAIREGKDHE